MNAQRGPATQRIVSRAFVALVLVSSLLVGAGSPPNVSAQEQCDIKVRIGDGAPADNLTLPIGLPLTISGSGFPGNEPILLLFEPPDGLGHPIPEVAVTDHTGAFTDSFTVEPAFYVEGIWTLTASPQDDDPATTECIDRAQLTVVTTPGGFCGLAASVEPGRTVEGTAELTVHVGHEFRVWGFFIPHVFVDVRFLVGGELRRAEPVLADGQSYIEFPTTFVAGEEGQWTVEAGVPGTQCRAAVAVTVSGVAAPAATAMPPTSPAPGPAAVRALPNTAAPTAETPLGVGLLLFSGLTVCLFMIRLSRREP